MADAMDCYLILTKFHATGCIGTTQICLFGFLFGWVPKDGCKHRTLHGVDAALELFSERLVPSHLPVAALLHLSVGCTLGRLFRSNGSQFEQCLLLERVQFLTLRVEGNDILEVTLGSDNILHCIPRLCTFVKASVLFIYTVTMTQYDRSVA